jgi:chitodextrinase
MKKRICSPQICGSALILAVLVLIGSTLGLAQTTGSLPTVSIGYPANGAAVSGQTYITINTEFNLPLTGQETQQVYLDGALLWSDSGLLKLAPSILWNTASLAPGAHTLVAVAKDALGSTATSSPISVTILNGSGPDTTPPTSPTNLTATDVTCDKVSLSWTASTDLNGSGVQAYTISRNDYPFGSISIAAGRTWFDDTDKVKSAATYTYYLVARDFAGNVSAASNSITVSTPACSLASGEEVFDAADMQPSGKAIATYGSLEAFVYQKLNPLTARYDSYLQFKDENTGAASKFLLQSNQYITDYILTSSTILWTLIKTSSSLLVSQYQLSGSPPSSATLVSTQAFGDTNSCPKSLLQLKSGAVVAVWTTQCGNYGGTTYMQLNIAYRNPSGVWAAPLMITLTPDTWKERIAVAQHPADGSVWLFNKQDTGQSIWATHITELSSGLKLDWTNPYFIATRDSSGAIQDGINGPGDEYPFLVAVPDSTRGAIDLAYQRNDDLYVNVDPLFQNGNGIFLKGDSIAVAQINTDGTRVFNVSPAYTERVAYFGLSVLGDGSIWLAYFPVNHSSLTWNHVYTTQYANSVWGASTPVGDDLNSIYDWSNSGPQWDPGFLIYRTDQPQVVFRAVDGNLHSYNLNGTPIVASTTAPSTPTNLAASNITTSSMILSWTASTDTNGVAGYNIYRCQGAGCAPALLGTTSSTSVQDTGLASGATYTYTVAAYDANNNVSGLSAPLSVTTLLIAPSVSITSPSNGAKLKNSSVTVSSSATDTVGVAKMELYIDGIFQTQTSNSSLSYRWNTNKIASGAHSITSKAYDRAGNMGSSSITVYK